MPKPRRLGSSQTNTLHSPIVAAQEGVAGTLGESEMPCQPLYTETFCLQSLGRTHLHMHTPRVSYSRRPPIFWRLGSTFGYLPHTTTEGRPTVFHCQMKNWWPWGFSHSHNKKMTELGFAARPQPDGGELVLRSHHRCQGQQSPGQMQMQLVAGQLPTEGRPLSPAYKRGESATAPFGFFVLRGLFCS